MTTARRRVGLIVNPIAGMGGRVGLKGSDGEKTLRLARQLGAVPTSPGRVKETLLRLVPLFQSIQLITFPAEMGESEAREVGLKPGIIGSIKADRTTAADTKRAGKMMVDLAVDLLLFAGGDGTARDIYQSVGLNLPVVGIPAGVKIHSGVYATSPTRAADLAAGYLQGQGKTTLEMEVMDIDEEAYRQGYVSAQLYGYLKVPSNRRFIQGAKAASATGAHEKLAMESIAEQIVETMDDKCIYLVGSGTTPRAIMKRLGLAHTLLGIDAVLGGKPVSMDLNEERILDIIQKKPAKIIITPIGGQGYLFGRGNQQLSPDVIKQVGRDNIVVVATSGKLNALARRPLLVDTGDPETDRMLKGYVRVVTGYKEERMCQVA